MVDVVKSGETVKLCGGPIEFDDDTKPRLWIIGEIDGRIVYAMVDGLKQTIPCQAVEGQGSTEGVETRR
jgi:hypothetical protein